MIYSFLNRLKQFNFVRALLRRLYSKYPRLVGKIRSVILMHSNLNTEIDRATTQQVKKFKNYLNEVVQENSKKIVLLLATYPFNNPRHGGQIRCNAIAEKYRKSGYIVIPFVVREEENYINESIALDEVIFPSYSFYRMYGNLSVPCISDYTSGIFAVSEPKVLEAIRRRIEHTVDIIHVEQPWLFKFAQKVQKSLPQFRKAQLIYGSQNIEYKLKESILTTFNVPNDIKNRVINDIKELEIFAANQANKVYAVSEDDKRFLENAVNKKIILSPNAAHKRSASSEKINFWKKKLPSKFYVFIASAHIPNIIGFASALDNARFHPDLKIAVVGSVTNLLDQHQFYKKTTNLDWSCLIRIGVVEEEDLLAILACAHGVLIPIVMGGGTNLKTAEALLSGKYVISTKIGFRGYEYYSTAPGVYLSETIEDFQKNIQRVWDLPDPNFASLRGRDLTWDYALNSLIEEVA